MLALMLISPSAFPLDEIPKPDFSCLTREQKEYIDISIRNDISCHAQLEKCNTPPPNIQTWQEVALYTGAGILLGFLLRGLVK
jgi:hypothetical protein